MEIKVGDTVFVHNLSLSWGFFTGELDVLIVIRDGFGKTLLTLGRDGRTIVSGIDLDRVSVVRSKSDDNSKD